MDGSMDRLGGRGLTVHVTSRSGEEEEVLVLVLVDKEAIACVIV